MFSRARNLLEESECSSRDVLSPAAKKQKVQALDPDLCDVLMTTEGCAPEAMVITISDECCDEVSASEADKIVLQALSFCEGWLSICAAPHLKEALHKLADFSARLVDMHARNDHAAASSSSQNTSAINA